MLIRKYILLLLCLLIYTNSKADETQDIVNKLVKQLHLVNDFSADVSIKIDISYLNFPEKKGKIYFKQPNKSKVDIDGFAMLPKQGSGNFINEILSDSKATYILSGNEKVQGIDCKILKVIPSDPKSDIAIANLWVDDNRAVVLKAEAITKKTGTYSIELNYQKVESKYLLPQNVVVSLSVPDFNLPKSITGDTSNKPKEAKTGGKNTEGKVYVNYSNFKVNTGILDSFFNDNKKSKK